jgi:hypothetical protein
VGASVATSGTSGYAASPTWSGMRAPICGLVIALTMIGLGAAQDGDAVRRALDGLASSLDLQASFPVAKERSRWWSFTGHLSADLVRVLIWIAVACGVAAIVWYLLEIVPKGFARRPRWDDLRDAGLSAAAGSVTAAQENADELASQGRFAEAMHVLLLQSVSDMRKRLDVTLADSLTSREILRRAPVSDVARAALADIIAAVERAYFGHHAVEAADYRLCRARFTALTEALHASRRL